MNNPVQWCEIAATDLERAKGFYAKVFNLEFQLIEMPDSKMYMFGASDKVGSSLGFLPSLLIPKVTGLGYIRIIN